MLTLTIGVYAIVFLSIIDGCNCRVTYPHAVVTKMVHLAFFTSIPLISVISHPRSVRFYTWLKFSSAPLSKATHVVVEPPAHQGKTVCIPLNRGNRKGRDQITFEFQKLTYIYETVR